jgi:hypothetical protein
MGFVVTIRRSGASSSPNAPIVTHRTNRNLTSKINDLEEDSTQYATMRVSPWRPLFGLIDRCLHATRIDLDVGGRIQCAPVPANVRDRPMTSAVSQFKLARSIVEWYAINLVEPTQSQQQRHDKHRLC